MSSIRLQDMSSKRLEDVLSVTIFGLRIRLQDVLEDAKLLAWRRGKTSSRPTNVSWERSALGIGFCITWLVQPNYKKLVCKNKF